MSAEAGYGIALTVTCLIAYTAMTLGSMRAAGMAGYYQDGGEVAPVRNVVRGGVGIVVAGSSFLVLALLAVSGGVMAGTVAVVIVAVTAVVALASIVTACVFSRRLFSYPPLPRVDTVEVH